MITITVVVIIIINTPGQQRVPQGAFLTMITITVIVVAVAIVVVILINIIPGQAGLPLGPAAADLRGQAARGANDDHQMIAVVVIVIININITPGQGRNSSWTSKG